MERLICIVIGYLFGLFQTGYIYGRLNHIDIREHGSGNAGTTNALRTLGKKAGIITFFGDCFKAFFAIALVRLLFRESHPDIINLLALYAGLGVILGHNFPFYLKFKGGKGIAATAGIILSFHWIMTLISLVIFVAVVAITRYVSLGSLLVVTGFLIQLVVMGQMGIFNLSQPHLYEFYFLGLILAALAFYKHKENIKRLKNGTENKLWGNKNT